MTPTNANPNTVANAQTLADKISAKLTGDWILFYAVTLLLMWHNGHTTYARVSHSFTGSLVDVGGVSINIIALAEALVTAIVVEYTSAHFLNAQKSETAPNRRQIAAIGVVVPLIISGVINLIDHEWVADIASRIATISCACIVAAWHWSDTHESPATQLRAEIKALADKLQAATRERDDALAKARAVGGDTARAAEIIRGLRDDIETLRREHNAALVAADARHRDDIERLTHQHSAALAAAKANATANVTNAVTVNVSPATNAQPVSTNAKLLSDVSRDVNAPLALTEDALALTIAQRRANGETVNSALLANLFNVSQSRIRQMAAWVNREVQHAS